MQRARRIDDLHCMDVRCRKYIKYLARLPAWICGAECFSTGGAVHMALQSQLFQGDAKLEVAAISNPAHADAKKLMAVIGSLKAAGRNLSQIPATLDSTGVSTARDGKWTAMRVRRTLERCR
jgi:hypothetical protein